MGNQILNEEALKAQAAELSTSDGSRNPRLRAGLPIPTGIENPKIGTPGHYCVDPDGNYQPTWFQMYLQRPTGMKASHEFFNLGGNKWNVAFNKWVDVPPEIYIILQDAQITVYESEVDRGSGDFTGDLTRPGKGPQPVGKEPAYHYTAWPSAR